MRFIWTLPLFVALGCGGPDLTTQEGVDEAVVSGMDAMADVLAGITDAESAEAARSSVQKLAERAREIDVASRALGKPSREEEKALEKAFEPAMEEAMARVSREQERLKAKPEVWAIVGGMMDDYFATAYPRAHDTQLLARQMQKQNNLRSIVSMLKAAGKLPMKDGALDVYALVKNGDILKEGYSVFRDSPDGLPSDEEIERGDYTNFPYHRFRGGGDPYSIRGFPLLWDKKPGADRMFVVAMSGGRVGVCDETHLKNSLGK